AQELSVDGQPTLGRHPGYQRRTVAPTAGSGRRRRSAFQADGGTSPGQPASLSPLRRRALGFNRPTSASLHEHPPCRRLDMNRQKTRRRTFLGVMAGMPGLPLLYGGGAGAAEEPSTTARNVIQELGVRSFINAAGTFTALTGSLMRPEVVAAMQVASRQYVKLEELQDAVGKRIAELLHCPSAMVTAGCASALSLATAACVAGKDPERIRRIPDTTGMKNEVIVQRTHRVGYDHAIRNAGVKMVEVVTRQ